MKLSANAWKLLPLALFLLACGLVSLDIVPVKVQNAAEKKTFFEVPVEWEYKDAIVKRGIVPVH